MKTSIHLKACDIAASEAHNRREKKLDYIREDLTHLNESFCYDDRNLQAIQAEIAREVKKKTGRKLQKNAIPIKEGVLVIKPDTTMKELRTFCDVCQKKFGIVPLQIHIHKDEGHQASKTWKPNLHAHIVWRMYNDDGRNVRLDNNDCREMQTLAAQVLGMERGVSSDKKHLDAIQYKIKLEEEKLQNLQLSRMAKEKLLGKSIRNENIDLREQNKALREEMMKVAEESSKIATNARQNEKKAQNRANEVERWKAENSRELAELDKHRAKLHALQEENKQLSLRIGNLEKNLPAILEEAPNFGVDTLHCIELAENKSVSIPFLRNKDGKTLSMEDGSTIKLRWNKRIEAQLASSWHTLKDWCREALRSPWCAVDGVSNNPKSRRMGL